MASDFPDEIAPGARDLRLRRERGFWRWQLVKWWIQGHGKDGYTFRLLLVPLVLVFVVVFGLLLLEQIVCALIFSAVMTVFLGVAGFHGTKRELLLRSAATRAVTKARAKQAAERFSSLGVGATVLAIFVSATSVSLALYDLPLLDTALKDAFSMFIALVFLPVYVSGAVRKLAVARIEELEALRNDTVGAALTRDRAGRVRAVAVVGPAARAEVPVRAYLILRFEPPVTQLLEREVDGGTAAREAARPPG
ncbi:hypothetical protein Bsp3421_000737 [Burkholderia sp. FERM BP-3421]|jgi:hypothetical protein|uniref:hypothetical protein n=1 Tax=Burkholderia sp. FERM BP-3421 TaxID=1494466 RepID=UPI00235ED2B7|nr:hypothetical protein [Burkholderia sp. FERM BP-3421]WDD90857.1 hypothetical protein Bsp3421_000737 [Burkholderia sp. FERM BP-3421]